LMLAGVFTTNSYGTSRKQLPALVPGGR
jgi:hypothetical protein